MTTLSSKVVGRLKRPMAQMCVDAVLSVADLARRDVNLDLIKVRQSVVCCVGVVGCLCVRCVLRVLRVLRLLRVCVGACAVDEAPHPRTLTHAPPTHPP